ncbi:MAG: cation transporter [Ignavibacteriaceae bacterium]
MSENKEQLLKTAFLLSIITIVYNLIEGGISIYFGMQDETLTLFGFGVDSFVEVISGIGIAHMIIRMRKSENIIKDNFEKTALKITGTGFYLLTVGLIAGSVINIVQNVKPHTTFAGIIISIISILTMYFLMNAKLKVGNKMGSEAVISDAKCTKACLQLSVILLAASISYELFHLQYIDTIGSLAIAYLTFKEGRESFEKAHKSDFKCCDDD